MAANLFDVFVVGSNDPSAAGETRLAAALSTKHGVPLPTVAKAIAAKNLRAGQGLEQAQAQALVRQLQGMGAVTVIRPAAGRSPANTGQSPRATQSMDKVSGVPPVASSAVSAVPSPSPGSSWSDGLLPGFSPATLPSSGGRGVGMPSVGAAAADPFAPLAPAMSPQALAGGRDPFQPSHVPSPVVPTARARTPPPAHQPVPSSSGLALAVEPAPRIELARGGRGAPPDDEDVAVARPRQSMSASSLREMDAGGASGVVVDQDTKNINLVRCVQHGLYYDKTKASGCRKCLAGARGYVSKIEGKDDKLRVADFQGKPAKRAFLGLTLALLLGFLPAAYYCFGPGATEAGRLRLEQEMLSRQPGTEGTLRAFDDLDVQVRSSHERSSRNTAIVWFAVTGVAMLGWYRIT
jgi:hypothetical protein